MEGRVLIELDDAVLLAAIDRALAVLTHPGELLEDIGAKLEGNVELRFDQKVDPSGVPWAPLSPVTVDVFYAAKYPGGIPGSLLQRTNLMRASLTHNVGDDYLELGTSRSVPGKSQPTWQVGFLHEFGTTKMPRRGILTADPKAGTLGAEDQADVLAVVSQAMLTALR